jgi:Ca2+-binding EF-hand superfamily protein
MRSPGGSTPNKAIVPKEMKELKRVFEQLCFFADKAEAMERLGVIRETLSEYNRPLLANANSKRIQQQQRKCCSLSSVATGTSGSSSEQQQERATNKSSVSSKNNPDEREKKISELQGEQIELETKLSDVRNRPVQHIRPQDTAAALGSLGMKATKREVQNMMWEVDEKLDGVLDWDEVHLNYERNIRDSSGLEPASFYHMIQFMIYDHDNNGLVSIDETMNMLYARVGRERMETTITKLFGRDDGAPIKEVGHQGGEIDFERYWEVVIREHQKKFQESDLGKVAAEKKERKKKNTK